MTKLHLCCGFDYKKGFLNVDNLKGGPQDITADLNKPWKFVQDSSVDYLFIKDGLEHMDSLDFFFEQVSRVLKPHGTAEIWVPHFKSPSAYKITHTFFFSWSTFDSFPEPHDPVQDLRAISNRLIVEGRVFPFTILNFFANLHPKFWERLFYASGIRVILEKVPLKNG